MLKQKKIIILLCFTAIIFFIFVINFFNLNLFKPELNPGQKVFAMWESNLWFHGKIIGHCSKGWQIHFDDGDKKCCKVEEIVKDELPSAGMVEMERKVLGKWTDGKFYPGIIIDIIGDEYTIQFNDGDKQTVSIEHIRLINR